MPLLQILMMLEQETGVLDDEHFVRPITPRYPTHTNNIRCQKENRLAAVPFAANDVFRIMEIFFTPRHFLILFQFWYILSI